MPGLIIGRTAKNAPRRPRPLFEGDEPRFGFPAPDRMRPKRVESSQMSGRVVRPSLRRHPTSYSITVGESPSSGRQDFVRPGVVLGGSHLSVDSATSIASPDWRQYAVISDNSSRPYSRTFSRRCRGSRAAASNRTDGSRARSRSVASLITIKGGNFALGGLSPPPGAQHVEQLAIDSLPRVVCRRAIACGAVWPASKASESLRLAAGGGRRA